MGTKNSLWLVRIILLAATSLLGNGNLVFAQGQANTTLKPNVLLIMADDLGFSDVGCYGGEIKTPNLDALAIDGEKYSHFYNSGRCCPSRAALLTGRTPHMAGMGSMVGRGGQKFPAGPYQGFIPKDVPTLAEVFSNAGYQTLMVGKWHVGEERENWPLQRGFHKYFGLISGASSYYEVLPGRLMLRQNEKYIPPAGFYATTAYSDSAVVYMKAAIAAQQPFLCYAAYTAPHWPLHAPEEYIKPYREVYRAGWDSLRILRLNRMKASGLLPANTALSSGDGLLPWAEVKDKDAEVEKMAVYAAMVQIMDEGIGKMVKTLKEAGVYDNTIIIFLSDNGGCHETIGGRLKREVTDTIAAKLLPPGPKGSYVAYGRSWANLSNTPFRFHKATIYEGGVASPLIAKLCGNPKQQSSGWVRRKAYITDIFGSLKEQCGLNSKPNSRTQYPLVRAVLFRTPQQPYYWEHNGSRGVVMGNLKLVSLKNKDWELYDLSKDRMEQNNLAFGSPARVTQMKKMWQDWADAVQVYPKPENVEH